MVCMDADPCTMPNAVCLVCPVEMLPQETGTSVFLHQLSVSFVLGLPFSFFFSLVCRQYFVTLTGDALSFGYSAKCGQMTVDRSQIRSAEAIEHINGLCEWGGYGIRKQLPSWETGYIAGNGPGVRITFLDLDTKKEKAYTFSCKDPEKVVDILTGS